MENSGKLVDGYFEDSSALLGLPFRPSLGGNVCEEMPENPGVRGLGEGFESLAERLVLRFEPDAFSGLGDTPVGFYPPLFDIGSQLPDSSPDGMLGGDTGNRFESGVHLQEPVVHRSSISIEDYLREGEPLLKRVDEPFVMQRVIS